MLPSGNDSAHVLALNFSALLHSFSLTNPPLTPSNNLPLTQSYEATFSNINTTINPNNNHQFYHFPNTNNNNKNYKMFIDMMNTEAKRLELNNTFFTNPHGL